MNCLLSTILDLCAKNNVNVRYITTDDTVVNINSMKLFRCKLRHSLEEVNGGFTHDDYNGTMARNALGELGIFLTAKVEN